MNNTDKKEKALRIMEAMSGVDEVLVDRSDKSTGNGKDAGKNNGGFRKIVSVTAYIAACIAFMFIGAGAYVGCYNLFHAKGTDENQSAAPAEAAGGFESAADSNGTALDMNNAYSMDENEDRTAQDAETAASKQQEREYNGDVKEETNIEAAVTTDNIGRHIPTKIPEKFEMTSCTQTTSDEYHDALITWESNKGFIKVYLTDYYSLYESADSKRRFADPAELTLDDINEKAQKSANGLAYDCSFMYSDGIYFTVSIDADITAEEIYSLLGGSGE